MEDILTTTQAAEKLGISARRVAALITAGKLPANQFGGSWMIRSEDLALVADRKPGRPKKPDEGETVEPVQTPGVMPETKTVAQKAKPAAAVKSNVKTTPAGKGAAVADKKPAKKRVAKKGK